jgi:orotate phosphoribosyltransferase
MSEFTQQQYASHIAQQLLAIKAVSLRPQQPFVWTSGLKSPIYCDNRLTMSYPAVRDLIAEGFSAVIKQQFTSCEVLAGTATAGIPHAAWTAQKLGLPMVYVRDKAKGHGKENLIEGYMEAGKKVVVIEDLISTGGSSIKAARAVRDAGAEVVGVVAIFSYQFAQAEKMFADENIPLVTLSNYSVLLDEALQAGVIQSSDLESLKAWRANPAGFA